MISVMNSRLLLVYQRKNGQVGPSLLKPFVKLWAIWGLMYFASMPVSLYLAPFRMTWLVSILRALVMFVVSWGSRLPMASYVYDAYVNPFIDAREPEIEQQLVVFREKWTAFKQQMKVMCEELWKQYNIGGVPGVLGTGRGEQEVAKQQADEFDPQTGQRVRNPRLPEGRSHQPFSAADRPDTVAEVAYRGVLIPPKSATPKAAYTGSRAFRESFRKRAKSTTQPSPKPEDET